MKLKINEWFYLLTGLFIIILLIVGIVLTVIFKDGIIMLYFMVLAMLPVITTRFLENKVKREKTKQTKLEEFI